MIVGQLIGKESLAAVDVANHIMLVIIFFFLYNYYAAILQAIGGSPFLLFTHFFCFKCILAIFYRYSAERSKKRSLGHRYCLSCFFIIYVYKKLLF